MFNTIFFYKILYRNLLLLEIVMEGYIMALKSLVIDGLRGFSEKTEIQFSIPDKVNPGSGLTVLVGPNNSGKSTVIEAVHLLSKNTDTIPVSYRNSKNDGYIKIEAIDTSGNSTSLQSTSSKGAFVQKTFNEQVINNHYHNSLKVFILTSKRGFNSSFNNNSQQNRENYIGNISNDDYRGENNFSSNFGGRLLSIYDDRESFDKCLAKVISPLPQWTIESESTNNLFLEFSFNGVKHRSSGAGDGYINIFNIIDSLYDSNEDNAILIDEPEISLHPDLQRKLFEVLVEYSKDRQIIISTHSPYFIDWKLFSNKSKIVRFKKGENSIKTYELSVNSKDYIKKIIDDGHNPHVLALDANEIFFLNDNVVLTEGQEDVLCYKNIFKQNNFSTKASFFGWGAGGESKVRYILEILYDLGYEKVFTILDNDKRDSIKELKVKFPQYCFYAIAANDVRTKTDKRMQRVINEIRKIDFDIEMKDKVIATLETNSKNTEGLVQSMGDYSVNPRFRNDINCLIDSIDHYFISEVNVEARLGVKELSSPNKNIKNLAIAESLLTEYITDNDLHSYIQNRYDKIQFNGGGGGILSLKNTSESTYYAIVEESAGISENHSVTVAFHFSINTKSREVYLNRKRIISNTLPISRIARFIEKVFN